MLVQDDKHPSEFVEINGKKVEIDKKLIPLIKGLNKVGLETLACCENFEKDGISYVSIKTDSIKTYYEYDGVLTLEWKLLG